MVSTDEAEAIRQSALKYQWFHNRDWTQMADGASFPRDGAVQQRLVRGTAGNSRREGHPGDRLVRGDLDRRLRRLLLDPRRLRFVGEPSCQAEKCLLENRDQISYAAYDQMKRVTFFPTAELDQMRRSSSFARSWPT